MRDRVSQRRPHGMAIMMVIIMIGLCAVLGYAMLWGASTNAQVADNAVLAAKADALAESGVNLAAYYLRHPNSTQVPANFLTTGDTYTASNVSLGGGIDGYVNLRVVRDVPGGWDFTITSTGVAQDGPLRVAQTLTSKVHLNTRFEVQHAVSSQSDTLIDGSSPGSISISGKLQTKGVLDLVGPVWITEGVYTDSLAPSSTTNYASLNAAPYQAVAPTWAQINPAKYTTPTYTYNGNTYTAATITSPLNASPAAANTTTNPLRIYYCATDLTVIASGSVTINGSLIVNGRLNVGTVGSGPPARTLTINPNGSSPYTSSPPAPGLVVQEEVNYLGPYRTVTSNGLTWIGKGVTGTLGANSPGSFIVNGALLVPSWPATRTYGGTMSVTYNANNVRVWDFAATSNQLPTDIIVRSFAPGVE